MGFRLGVDIGGTFTDFCAFDEQTGALHTLKVRSRPEAPGEEIVTGLAELKTRYEIAPQDIVYFTHGTTVGINTVIQRRGLKLCLFCTENFVDVLEIARLKMPDPYDLLSVRPTPLIPRDRVLPIRERTRADGSEDEPVDAASVDRALAQAKALGAEGIVIALINSYRNAAHEHEVRDLVRAKAPDLPVFCSADVWSIIREYERTLTAIIHSYVQPRVSHYLTSLQQSLADAGVPATALVTKSNGGVMSAELAKRDCAQMILSGTASGVIGASHIAGLAGITHCMSLDIGGTSADVAFVVDGQPQYGVGEMIGEFPIYVPSVAVTSIGAGGGSIAWIDEFGVLRVGPDSAGANPGPACYGRGGSEPTITDAMAVLGIVGQQQLGYQSINVDVSLARTAIDSLAQPLNRSVEDTAQAVIEIAVSEMYLEVSKLVSKYGIDLREFSLLAFGGAGPMMGCLLAQELGMRDTVIPATPGVLSALGGLVADIKNDFIATVFLDLTTANMDDVLSHVADLECQATYWLREEQGYAGSYQILYSADMRYRGQSFEIETLLSEAALKNRDIVQLAESFHQEHERVYEHADTEADVQIINLRLVIVGESAKPKFAPTVATRRSVTAYRHVAVHVQDSAEQVAWFERDDLQAGAHFNGPAIVSQADATTWVPAGARAEADAFGNLVISPEFVGERT